MKIDGVTDLRLNSSQIVFDVWAIVLAGANNIARIWEIDGEEIALMATLQGHSSMVWDAAFSSDDTRVATISFDGSVKLWDVLTEDEWLTLPQHRE